jgi:hypothetical protein
MANPLYKNIKLLDRFNIMQTFDEYTTTKKAYISN